MHYKCLAMCKLNLPLWVSNLADIYANISSFRRQNLDKFLYFRCIMLVATIFLKCLFCLTAFPKVPHENFKY